MTEDEKKYFDMKYTIKYRVRWMKASDLNVGDIFYHDLDSLIADSKRFVYKIENDIIIAQCISKNYNEDNEWTNNVRTSYNKNDDIIVRAEKAELIMAS